MASGGVAIRCFFVHGGGPDFKVSEFVSGLDVADKRGRMFEYGEFLAAV
jgi:hypothetical protein